MKIKKLDIQGILQYLCDIDEFGFEDDNIESMELWVEKARFILDKLEETDFHHFEGVKNSYLTDPKSDYWKDS